MKALHSKTRLLVICATILLLILAFPSTLNARSARSPELNSIGVTAQRPSEAFQHLAPIVSRQRQSRERESLVLDEDIRVRAATVLMGDPVIKTSGQTAHVPLTVLVITAPVIVGV
jgi:hypothetical protein